MGLQVVLFISPISHSRIKEEIMERAKVLNLCVVSPEEFRKNAFLEQTLESKIVPIFVGTGGTENLIIDFIRYNDIHERVLLITIEDNNSLPAALETRSYLERHGYDVNIIHLSENALNSLQDESIKTVLQKIAKARIGVVGNPSSWLVALEVDYQAIAKMWGLELVNYDISSLMARMAARPSEEFTPNYERFLSQARTVNVSSDSVSQAVSFTEVLDRFVRSECLDAVTMECFRLLMETGVSGCHALSYINSTGLTAGCEGDIPSTFTMLLARMITGQDSFMANVVSLDIDQNTVVFAHCTVPTSIVKEYDIMTHFETGQSVAIRGRFSNEDVTVFKVFGRDLSKWWVAEGKIIDNLSNERACRTQIKVLLEESVEYFLSRSLANHHVIIPGRHKKDIIRVMSVNKIARSLNLFKR